MCRITYSELAFDHIVVFSQEDAAFACCRENGSGRTRLFLAFGTEQGRVYTRNGVADSWEQIPDYDADAVRNLIRRAIRGGITVYTFNGNSQAVTGNIKAN